MDWFAPRFRRDPNEKVDSIYIGVASGNRTITSIRKRSRTADAMETSLLEEGPMMPRAQGGQIGTLILGGMETSLDEMEELLQATREERFVPERTPGDIVRMCEYLADWRNERIKHLRRNPSERLRQRRPGLYLPLGYRLAPTNEPGMRITVRG